MSVLANIWEQGWDSTLSLHHHPDSCSVLLFIPSLSLSAGSISLVDNVVAKTVTPSFLVGLLAKGFYHI